MTVFALSALFEKFKINSHSFQLSENLQSSRDGSGQTLVSSLGPRLWYGSISLSAMSTIQARSLSVLLQQLQRPENTFYIYDKLNAYPSSYVSGDNLANVKITTPVQGYSVNFSGFPANYKIMAGDYFSVIKGGISFLFQISDDINANGSGVVTAAKLLNPLPAGFTTLTTATFIKPYCHARYSPGSMKIGNTVLGYTEGASFDWVQTFKV